MAHILLGVTGSIAAFKACHLASDWSKQGHEVCVAMTAAAQEFVTPLTFSSLTHTQTRTSMFAAQRNDGDVAHTPSDPLHINHVDDAKWADMLVIAPTSADIIAKIACGIADDQLTSTVLAYSEGPKILCPAMNVHMYENAVTQRNLNACRALPHQSFHWKNGLCDRRAGTRYGRGCDAGIRPCHIERSPRH